MKCLVDTNVLSELRKGASANADVRRWWNGVGVEDVYISVIVLGEIRRSVERIRRRDVAQAAVLDRWFDQLETTYADKILVIDARVADTWGRLQVPNPLPEVDGLLAATAIVHDLVLVTRNIKDMQATGARCLDPFGR